jgi:hypothetical protein
MPAEPSPESTSEPLEQPVEQLTSASIWHYKPWWCQPWSILLTGFGLIGASWLLFHRVWLTGLVSLPLGGWMFLFLVLYPQQMQAYLEANPQSSLK